MATSIRSIKSLVPLLDRVLVQRIKAEAKTAGGIFLPESSVKELNEAKVLAVGPGALSKDGARVPMGVAQGDRVLIPQVSLTEVMRAPDGCVEKSHESLSVTMALSFWRIYMDTANLECSSTAVPLLRLERKNTTSSAIASEFLLPLLVLLRLADMHGIRILAKINE
ncbi:chaperonin 10-like protein [Xylaria sp. FL0933]|nr:chaperonin 10-like protein [Xylaria sp. FL0933]